MKKLNLLFLLALLFAVGGAKVQAYTEKNLTDAGWEVVTSLDDTPLSQYYYVFYSVQGENLMLAQGYVDGYQQNLLTGVYRTATNPIEEESMVWTLEYSDDFKYGLRNLSNPVPYMQSRNYEGPSNPGPWSIQFNAAWSSAQNQWTRFNLAYSDSDKSWTIENNAANDNGDTQPYQNMFIGPWDENVQDPISCFADGKAVAGNKEGNYVGHFKLYRMKKAVYYGKKYYPEFTAVTSTDQLTAENMAANYYIVVAETNLDLAVTARNKVDDPNVRLKYVTQSVFTNAAQIWTLQANGEDGYSFRNLKKDHALLQAHTEAWGTNIADEQTAVARTKFKLTSDGNTGFTILNSSFPNNYLGLWHPTHGYSSEELMAGNKTEKNEIGHFFVYAISRSDYKTQFLAKNSEVTDLFMTNPHVENAYGWDGTKKTFDRESFNGAPDNICLDLNNSGNTYQFVTLPAGNYLIKVATRGISDADAGIYVKLKGAATGDDLVNVQVQKKDNTGNELGNGWGWTYLPFSIAEEKELEIGFYVKSGAYAGADDFHLYNTNVVTRTMPSGRFGTICLPKQALPSGAEVYSVSSISDGNLSLETVDGYMTAGVPYLFKATQDNPTFTMSGDAVDAPVAVTGLVGTFESISAPKGDTFYVLSNNKLYNVDAAANVTVGANRAYINLNAVPASEARGSVFLTLEGYDPTGIGEIRTDNTPIDNPASDVIYDLYGRRVSHPRRGIYVVNGKKILFK